MRQVRPDPRPRNTNAPLWYRLGPKASVLKKRPTLKDLALKKAKRQELEGKKAHVKPKFIRAERIVAESIATSNEAIRLQRAMSGNVTRGEQPQAHTLCFVFRIRGDHGTTPQTLRILQLLRLYKPYTGVFLEFNQATMTMLRLVRPYVCYGTPSMKNVKDLVYKRAYCRPDPTSNAKVPVADNTLIEDHLGESCGIICVEDLVHEIVTCDTSKGDQFKRAVRFLAPFDLDAPIEGQRALLVKAEKVLSGFQPQATIVELITGMV